MISHVTTRVAVVGGCSIFTLVMAALHVLRPDLPPLDRGLSRYAGGGTLVPATVAFLALAGAWVVLAKQVRATPHSRMPLIVAAVGLVVVAATPIGGPSPPAIVLSVHTIGGLLFYLGTARAMLAIPATGTSKRLFGFVYVTALSLFVLGAMGVPPVSDAVGLLQRLVFASAILWALDCATR